MKTDDPANMVGSMTIPTQNFKSNQFRKPDLFVVMIVPYFIALRILITPTCTTEAITFGERIASNPLPPFVLLENVMGALMK